MAVSVKAYLNNDSDGQEIRRFSIPQEASTNFEYLAGKIRQVYPSLLRREFKLYWKDNEGEYVVFSTDEELLMALGSLGSQDYFKVYIEELPKNGGDSGPADKRAKHPGVICDVCDKEVEGTRFKCLTCPDYDLCSICENKGFHPEHQMLRIRTPVSHPMMGFWHFMFGPGSRDHQTGSGCSWRPRHHGPHGSRRGPHCPQAHPHGPFDWARHGRRGGGPGFFGPWGCNGWRGEQNNASHTDNKKENGPKDDVPAYPTFQEIFDNISEVVGESIRAAAQDSWGFEPQNAKEPQTDEKKQPTSEQEEHQSKNEQEKDMEAEAKDQDGDSQMPQNESFVVVDKSTDEQTDKQPEANDLSQSEQRRRQEEEFERKLNEAIKQMENMGFNNESGWLTQLLIAKDFDIGRVIDTLQSKD